MHARLNIDRLSHRAVLAGVAVLLCAVPAVPTRIAGFLLIAGLLPGLGVVARSAFAAPACIGLATALSPVMFGATVLISMWLGAPVDVAAWIAVAACPLFFVVAYRGGDAHGHSADDRRALVGVAILVLVAAALAFSLPLAKFWWRARDDSWFHAAVTQKLIRDGLPVTDPYFAGLRLQYMYFYHGILAACSRLTGIDAFHAMITVNAIALVSCASAFHALAGLFSRRVAPRVLGTALWLFGMNGWFYLFWASRIARAFTGKTRGLEVLRQLFPWSPNGHATAASLITVEGNQFMFLDKFMIGTAFSLTLSLAATAMFLLLRARQGHWSWRHDSALFLSIGGAMVLHAVAGVALAVVTAAVLSLLMLVRAQTSRGGPSYVRLMLGIGIGVAVTLPYLSSVAPRGAGHAVMKLAFQPRVAVGLLADVLPALVFAVLFFRRAGDDSDSPERLGARPISELTLSGSGLVALWTLFMLMVALTVDLTTNNETKFAFFVWLPLCVLSVGAFERWGYSPVRWRWLVLIVATTTLPLHMLYFHHAVRDRSVLFVSDEERAVYGWIRKNTPRDAMFLEEDDIVRVPVLADRDLYWGNDVYAHNWGYPVAEMNSRRQLRDDVFAKTGPSTDDVLQLRVLGRRTFVIYRRHHGDTNSAPERFRNAPNLRGKFATSDIAVWEVILD
ncbi:MAG TPA: hypothetical protein VFH88_08845 [Candidatus Krumholzibacteria bacterium]|nr:hypothetical protein [Candidatus Krumholzibacteria bacterium]